MIKKRALLLILIVLALLVYGCAAQEVPIPEEVPQIKEELPEEAAELPKPETIPLPEQSVGLGDLCSGEDQCISFCQNNLGKCQEYCKGNQENVLCQKYFGEITIPEIEEPTPDLVPQGEMDSMIQDMMEQMMGGGIPSTIQKKEEAACDKTPIPRKFNTNPYYTGLLVDSHIHMPSAFQVPPAIAQQADWDAPVLDKDVYKSELICLLDKEHTNSAFGFYLVTNMLSGTFVNAARQMEQKYPGRIAPFLTPSHLTDLDLTSDEIEEILVSNPGLFKGLGEIAFYKASYKGMSPEDPAFLKIYDLANKHNLIVMIHADEGQQQVIQRILQKYPNVIFLFHGNVEMGPYAAEVVAKYPNAYFTIDGDLWDLPKDHQSVNLYGAATKEEFISDFKRDYKRVQSAAIARWKNAIEKYPDKFLWGTDRGKDWHFDPEVGALLEESARSFIGQLNPAVQEKFAYKNAERLIEISGIQK